MRHSVYLDHAASTPLDDEVRKVMLPWMQSTSGYGNASSIHALGIEAAGAIDAARERVAGILHCSPEEVIFTGGGTESANMAVLGAGRAMRPKGKVEVITSEVEHHAVLLPARQLAREGSRLQLVEVDPDGTVSEAAVVSKLGDATGLVSVMYANNELGTVNPIDKIGLRVHEAGAFFHTDACQAGGALPLDTRKLHVDLMTINGSKIYGPKGVGVLYIRRGTPIEPLMYGGGQERNLRPGTENVAAIVGFAEALYIAQHKRVQEQERLTALREYCWAELQALFGDAVRMNGPESGGIAGTLNFSIRGADGEALVIYLSQRGVYCSTGSACDATNESPSHVLKAIHVPEEFIGGLLRWSMGCSTTKKSVDFAVKQLRQVSETLGLI